MDSAYKNYQLLYKFIKQVSTIHTNRVEHLEKCREYAKSLPKPYYVSTTTFTWDQEAEDSFPIELPHKPLWDKRGLEITRTTTDENVPHEGTIDAGWKYRQICRNPVTSSALNDTSFRGDGDNEEGIQKRFEELRALYRGISVYTERASSEIIKVVYDVSIENAEEEIKRANEELRLRGQREVDSPYYYMNTKNDYKKQEEEEEAEPWPLQIKNQPERSEELLDEWYLRNPPTLRRQICTDLVERYTGADKRLEWLSGCFVEEEDNEEKNIETFGPEIVVIA